LFCLAALHLFLWRVKVFGHIVSVRIIQHNKDLVNQVYQLVQSIGVMIIPYPKADRDVSSVIGPGNFCAACFHSAVPRDPAIRSALQETFQVTVQPRVRRHVREQVAEFKFTLFRIDTEVQHSAAQPDKPEAGLAVPHIDLIESAKDSSVGVRPERIPHDLQRICWHLVSEEPVTSRWCTQ
jgi:hypothetical protein